MTPGIISVTDIKYPRKDEVRGLLVDMGDTTHEPRVIAHPPFDLLTDGGDGPYRRLRVDVAQTGFFAGREFRTFFQADIPSLQTVWIHASIISDIILFNTTLITDGGIVEMKLYAGGTASGSWSPLPVFRRNTMSVAPMVANKTTLFSGGAHADGILIDVIRLTGGKEETVGGNQGDERGVGPGNYYYGISNIGNHSANVIFHGWWEERT